ncbi:cytochrome P450, partial [Penicillium cf. viridicatum]
GVLDIEADIAPFIAVELHKKYSPVVRIGPNAVDLDLPEMINTIYDTRGEYATEFYHASSALINGKVVYNTFSETDPVRHKKDRKYVAKFYSPAATTAMEPLMDNVINQLCQELEKRFLDCPTGPEVFDLGDWLKYYTYDVVGTVTFSRPIGYLEHGYDFTGVLANGLERDDYLAFVGTMPFLDYFLAKNPLIQLGPPGFNAIGQIAAKRVEDRYLGRDGEYHNPDNPDHLDKFIEVKKENPEVDDNKVISWVMNSLLAGSETTTVTLQCAFYYSLRNPRIWDTLTNEVLSAGLPMPVSYKDTLRLPYVHAVVREALRFLPTLPMA